MMIRFFTNHPNMIYIKSRSQIKHSHHELKQISSWVCCYLLFHKDDKTRGHFVSPERERSWLWGTLLAKKWDAHLVRIIPKLHARRDISVLRTLFSLGVSKTPTVGKTQDNNQHPSGRANKEKRVPNLRFCAELGLIFWLCSESGKRSFFVPRQWTISL